ncbi:autotransporter outer membrane beta-barrel domain-containing protein [Roseobacter sp. HKCCD9010]|nr:autotransporter outer membrane beta-barrel domain-containing protein [Rhodobacterales bacterium HKCCD4356]NNV14020.1 autotransporter outer membrane beta-barrel domain-containing protein [Roseobacter sp. HKCCD7357]NNV18261.1 autotransporter outer membrane beta-barrel domain-containing protein [Roseobacter sp. HKCCD8768]NNV27719.1 autotransporter outer membrane beta-barrel domain-containing protein [Roseobacter sp. HKCCD8192]NNV31962.1 autotransporter outer membrane beta-barrel domain-containi
MALFVEIEKAASNANANVTVKGGAEITTDGRQAHGALASAKGNGDAHVVMEGAGTRITTNGANNSDGDGNSYGLWASVTQFQGEGGFGNATAEMKGGNIRMNNGSNAYAVYASIKNKENEATATARLTNGSIRTMTHRGYGLFALTNGTGETAAVAEVLGGNIRTNVNDDGNNAYGLWAYLEGVTSDEARAIVRMAEEENVRTTVRTSGSSSFGIVASTTALGHVEAQMEGGTLITDGALAHGAFAWIYGADNASTAVMNMTGGEIETSGDGAYGIAAEVSSTSGGVDRTTDSTATATVNMSGGEIETSGADARGIVARSSGLGAVSAQMSGGRVTTVGQESHGLVAQITNAESNAAATVGITGGKVRTVGHFASGLWATTEGVGNATAEMKGGTVRTYEAESHGLFVEISNAGSAATATANITGGEITTEGGNAHGVYVVNLGNATAQLDSGKAIVNLGTGAVVAASGTGADGIRAEGARGFDVDVAGTVTGGSGNGAAIRTISSAGGTIDIASTARVTAGTSGLAIQDGDGDAVITSAGTIVGDVRLGAGDDRLTLAGGSVTGGVDGGAGGNDHLTLSGQIRTTLDNFINWEHLTLKDGTTLRLDGTDRLDMDLSIDAGSVFHATGGGSPTGATIAGDVANASGGGITIRGGVTNSGTLSVQDGKTGDVITIEGDYTGSGTSVLALDARLDGNGSNTDRLVITGDASGETMLSISGLDSAGAEVTALEIDVVSVGGQSDGTFKLMNGNHVTAEGEHALVSGAYLYRLAETGRGWALSALSEAGGPVYQPSAPIYDSYGQSLLALNGPASLRSRGSSEDFRSLAWDGGPATQSAGSPLWFQMGTEQVTLAAEHSTTGAALDSGLWEIEIGGDVVLSESGAGLLVGGLQFSYATGSASVTSDFGDGSIDTSGFGLGVTATWYDTRRFYVDGQVTVASYSSDLEADRIGSLADGNGGTGLALSIEAGQQLDLGARLTVIPQAQLSLSSVAFDDFDGERYGEQVTLEDASSQQLRLGLEFGAQEAQETRRLYGIVNLFHEFGAGSEVNVAGATLTTESEPWAVGVGFGGNYALTDRVDLFGEASYATGLSNAGDTSALSANAGLKVVF